MHRRPQVSWQGISGRWVGCSLFLPAGHCHYQGNLGLGRHREMVFALGFPSASSASPALVPFLGEVVTLAIPPP